MNATQIEKITTTKLAEQVVEKWALENINRTPIALALSNLLEEVHEALVLAAKGEVVVDEQQYCYTKPD